MKIYLAIIATIATLILFFDILYQKLETEDMFKRYIENTKFINELTKDVNALKNSVGKQQGYYMKLDYDVRGEMEEHIKKYHKKKRRRRR